MKDCLIHRTAISRHHHTADAASLQEVHGAFKWNSLLVFIASSALSLFVPAADAAPSAREILATARNQQSQQEIEVQGQLRGKGKIVPFRFTQSGPVIRYTFTNPDEALQLRLGEDGSELREISRSGGGDVSGAEWGQKVRGTPITYEDLALRFLYWPDAKVVGEDYINTRRVWKLEIPAPPGQSQYSKVNIWVEQQGGGLMRMEAYDAAGRLVKRFEVVSAQKIEGRWFLKQMRIEEFRPGTSEVQSRTYLDIRK